MSLLERLAADYPATPPAARLKAALLFHGVRYDPCLGEAGEWAFPSYMPHQALPGEPLHQGRNRFTIPALIRFDDQTQVRMRVKRDSPFVIRDGGGPRRYELLEGERPVAPLTFEPVLPWSEALTADGTPMRATGLSQHGDMLVLNVAPGCEYFVAPRAGGERTDNLSCTFCLYGLPDQRMENLGQKLYDTPIPARTLDRVAEACRHPETHARHLYLVGGSMLRMEDEGERYVGIARHLAERGLTERYFVTCGSGAIPGAHMRQMRDLGVQGACFNVEIWEPAQFARICPGKERYVGRDRWLDALVEATEVFGKGNVMSAFVAGPELEGDGAMTDPEAALAANVEAGEWLIPRGILPVYSIFWKVSGKDRGQEPIYTLDLFLRLNEALADIRRRHGRPANPNLICRRCAYMELEPDYDAPSSMEAIRGV